LKKVRVGIDYLQSLPANRAGGAQYCNIFFLSFQMLGQPAACFSGNISEFFLKAF
jgi:hypothetical protein